MFLYSGIVTLYYTSGSLLCPEHFEEGIRKAKEKEEHEKGETTQNQETNTPPKDSDAGPLDVENFILEFAHRSHGMATNC